MKDFMSVRRTYAHGPSGGWSAISVHLEAAEATKEGFYLTLFPDGKSPQVVFLRPRQLAQLVDMAASSSVTDPQLWDEVAKIPLEPLLPNRSLAARLRTILVDQATAIREQVRTQGERTPPPSVNVGDPNGEHADAISDGLDDGSDHDVGALPTPWKPPSGMP
jgi:hypothetical protein